MTIVTWADLKATDFASLRRERALAVLPIGAVEQHGPHLPLGTDSQLLAALLARLAGRHLRHGTAYVLPLLPVGLSPEHGRFAGTLSVGAETLLTLWCDLGRAVARTGIRRLVILNSHGGNAGLAELAALRLRAETGLLVATLTTHRLGVPPDLVPAAEQRYGIHAGAIETAMMQAVAPHLVDDAAIRPFASIEPALTDLDPQLGAAGGAVRLAWLAGDLNAAGAIGDATLATPAMGETILGHLTERVADLLDGLLRLDPKTLRPTA